MLTPNKYAIVTAIIIGLAGPSLADGISNPGGSSSITAGNTPVTCTSGTSGVLFQSSGKVGCDSGFTYAGSGGAVAVTGSVNLPTTTSNVAGVLTQGIIGPILHTFGTNSAFFGITSGNFTLSGSSNTGLGNLTLNALTSGAQNTAVGNGALTKTTGGSNSVAVGNLALNNNLTGGTSVAVGASTLTTVTAGFENVALGYNALSAQTTSASGNTAVGYQAGLSNTSGQNNIYIGITTNAGGNGITTGSGNVVIGGASITGLSAALANSIIIGDGVGNIRLDYGNTTASVWTTTAPMARPANIANGSVPTLTGTCTTGTQTGGNTAGKFVATCTAQTVIMTFSTTAPTGWVCNAHDLTTPADALNQTASSQTTATLTGTTVASDVIQFDCTAF